MVVWKRVAPEPEQNLRKLAREGRATQQLAQYMWRNGWKDKVGKLLPWHQFLAIVKTKYYRFGSWANRELKWAEVEEKLHEDCVKVIEKGISNFRKSLEHE